jgi:flagellar motility protein MotE (MotC chaperone)
MSSVAAVRRSRQTAGMAPVRFPSGGATLPRLLLVTAFAAFFMAVIKLPPLVERVAAIALATETVLAPPGSSDVMGPDGPAETGQEAAIEPAAGPASAAASATEAAAPYRVEALEAIAAEQQHRQSGLEERERGLALREATLALVEERIKEQVGRLENLKAEIDTRIGSVSREEEARIAHLVKVYEAMKAKSAAGIFESMGLELLISIVRGMRDAKVAAIVAEMAPDKARALTAELAKRRELPTLR